jgi:hypothetical protein
MRRSGDFGRRAEGEQEAAAHLVVESTRSRSSGHDGGVR